MEAHAFKSCSGTFGGKKLLATAQEMEDSASHANACSNGAAVIRVRQVTEETLVAYFAIDIICRHLEQ